MLWIVEHDCIFFQSPYLNGAGEDSVVPETAGEVEPFPNHLFKVSLKHYTVTSFSSTHVLSKYCFSNLHHPTSEPPLNNFRTCFSPPIPPPQNITTQQTLHHASPPFSFDNDVRSNCTVMVSDTGYCHKFLLQNWCTRVRQQPQGSMVIVSWLVALPAKSTMNYHSNSRRW